MKLDYSAVSSSLVDKVVGSSVCALIDINNPTGLHYRTMPNGNVKNDEDRESEPDDGSDRESIVAPQTLINFGKIYTRKIMQFFFVLAGTEAFAIIFAIMCCVKNSYTQ